MNSFKLQHPAGEGIPVDWVDVTVPMQIADKVDEGHGMLFETDYGARFPVVTQFVRGNQGINVRVLASFASDYVYGSFVPNDGLLRLPDFMRHPSIPAEFRAEVHGEQNYVLHSRQVLRENQAERLERISFSDGDGVVVMFVRMRSMHPVVDVGVRFARRATDGMLPRVTFDEAHEVNMIDGFASGLPMQIDPLCAPTQWYRITYEPVAGESMLERKLRSTAKKLWPIGACTSYATHNTPDGARWLTLGVMPTSTMAYRTTVRNKIDDLLAHGSFYDKREGAQALSANQAGTQRFGIAEGGLLELSNLSASYRVMRVIAGDEELRPIHYYREDGKPIELEDHKQLRTHNRRLDWRNSKDKLWFTSELPRVAMHSRRTTDDEQHTDDLGIDAFLALWDDPALEESRRMMVMLDFADTQTINGWTNSAARGIGRPLLSLATAAWLFGKTEAGMLAKATCIAIVHNTLATWEGKDVPAGRPIMPISTIKGNASWALFDPRTMEPMRAAAPYEHATVIVGCLAAAEVLTGTTKQPALGLATMLTQTVMNWLHRESSGALEWPFIVGCFDGVDDGLPLPQEWCVEGAPQFGLTRVPGGSWTVWTGATAFAVSYLMSKTANAKAILGKHLPNALKIQQELLSSSDYLTQRFIAMPAGDGVVRD